MSRITRIKIEGFRRLASVDLEMRPMMVMIGANGVGKTSVLDAISLLSESANGRLGKALSDLGGISSVLTRGKAENVNYMIRASRDNTSLVSSSEPFSYDLKLVPRGTGYAVESETLDKTLIGSKRAIRYVSVEDGSLKFREGNTLLRPSWHLDPNETALSQAPMAQQAAQEFRVLVATTSIHNALDVSQRAPIKLPQQLRPVGLPGPDGEALLPFLFYLKETERDRYDVLLDALHAGFPTFEELMFSTVGAGMLALAWKDSKFRQPMYMNELSEGTLRFLWLVALLQSPFLPAITMIDEPEVSLHPELLSLLADLMREASKRTQLIVATHSDRFIRFLQPNEVLVLDSDEEGLTTATWADSLDLEKWLEEYSLDDVWRMGRIGGRA